MQKNTKIKDKKNLKTNNLNGLSSTEYQTICTGLGRKPNDTELAIFSAMWSEHCSYKSSRYWLKLLPSKGKYVLGGEGENAGIVDIGNGLVAVFKIESHNHPSFIEPYQGASTGVGGIMRDIFTMGARPVANLNSLRFGSPEHPKTDFLLRNIVAGIGDYGNCVGIPTVGGELEFDEAYNNNILVNAMCVGIAQSDQIFYSAASSGNIVLYMGSETGMDGIHGATMASASFVDDEQKLRPTVQVGDPFAEKKLLEACLELMQHDAIVAIQDMGAAGLTSSSVEMAHKGNSGMELNLDQVPCRSKNMTPADIMLSESQERMLIVIKPKALHIAKKICDKWQLPIKILGKTNNSKKLTLKYKGETVVDLELAVIAENSPIYVREQKNAKTKNDIIPKQYLYEWPKEPQKCLLEMLKNANLCTRRAVTEQYDATVMANTIRHSTGNAAIIRINDDSNRAIALSCDSLPFHCLANPFEGGKASVAKSWRNLTSVGALPIAFTNCLNFASPEKPEIMKQFVEVLKGMRETALELDFPVVSGNVSFYNETNNISIPPTPVIGGLGIINDLECFADNFFPQKGLSLFLIGESEKNLAQTRFCQIIHKIKIGEISEMKLEQEKNNGSFIREIIAKKLCKTVRDIADGGLMVALAKMMLDKSIGANISISKNEKTPHFLFNETPSRYLIACETHNQQKILDTAQQKKVYARHIGQTQGNSLKIDELCDIKFDDILNAYENPEYQLLKPLMKTSKR